MSERKYFKYIRSGEKDITGKTIYSGQIVSVHGRINQRQKVRVLFEPSFGFRIQGNNFADAYDIKIETDISLINKISGAIKFAIFNITGYYKKPKVELFKSVCPFCDEIPKIIKEKRIYQVQCKNVTCGPQPSFGGASTIEEAIGIWNRRCEQTLISMKAHHLQ